MAAAAGGANGVTGRPAHREMLFALPDATDLVSGFVPETELERVVSAAPELLAGLAWGKPRRGHPEGTVGAHVADLLARLDEAGYAEETRSLLRFVALVHDGFKYRVHEWLPKTGDDHHPPGRADSQTTSRTTSDCSRPSSITTARTRSGGGCSAAASSTSRASSG